MPSSRRVRLGQRDHVVDVQIGQVADRLAVVPRVPGSVRTLFFSQHRAARVAARSDQGPGPVQVTIIGDTTIALSRYPHLQHHSLLLFRTSLRRAGIRIPGGGGRGDVTDTLYYREYSPDCLISVFCGLFGELIRSVDTVERETVVVRRRRRPLDVVTVRMVDRTVPQGGARQDRGGQEVAERTEMASRCNLCRGFQREGFPTANKNHPPTPAKQPRESTEQFASPLPKGKTISAARPAPRPRPLTRRSAPLSPTVAACHQLPAPPNRTPEKTVRWRTEDCSSCQSSLGPRSCRGSPLQTLDRMGYS